MEEYLNPTPSSAKRNSVALQMKKKAGRALAKHGRAGAHLDDMGDIYDHTKTAFGNGSDSDASDADMDQVEQGERRIKGDIGDLMGELDPKVYSAAKVTREQREKKKKELSEDDESDIEDDMEDESAE